MSFVFKKKIVYETDTLPSALPRHTIEAYNLQPAVINFEEKSGMNLIGNLSLLYIIKDTRHSSEKSDIL